MALIQWNNGYSVNVAEIDQQHQTLIRMINELNDAMSQGKGKEVLGRIIGGLTAYTGTHFATEERYFDRFGYPDADSHKQNHAAFVRKVGDVREKFRKGQLGLTIEILDFLSDWLGEHITRSDRQYGPFFNQKGLH